MSLTVLDTSPNEPSMTRLLKYTCPVKFPKVCVNPGRYVIKLSNVAFGFVWGKRMLILSARKSVLEILLDD
jgi:hypothetical protein